jgi:hypothetical protein
VGVDRLDASEDMLLLESPLPVFGMAVGERHVHTGSPVALARRGVPPSGGRDRIVKRSVDVDVFPLVNEHQRPGRVLDVRGRKVVPGVAHNPGTRRADVAGRRVDALVRDEMALVVPVIEDPRESELALVV